MTPHIAQNPYNPILGLAFAHGVYHGDALHFAWYPSQAVNCHLVSKKVTYDPLHDHCHFGVQPSHPCQLGRV